MTMTPERAREFVGHTPGPWRRSRMSNTAIEGVNGRGVCSTGGYSDNHSDGAYVAENIANADLVEASYDLLTAYLASEDRVQSLIDDVERLRGVLEYAAWAGEKIADCVKRNIYHQPEKLDDAISMGREVSVRSKEALKQKEPKP